MLRMPRIGSARRVLGVSAAALMAGALCASPRVAIAEQDPTYEGQSQWLTLDGALAALSSPKLCGTCFGIASATRDGLRVVAVPADPSVKADIATVRWTDLDLSHVTVTVGLQPGGKIGYVLYVNTKNQALAVHHEDAKHVRLGDDSHLLWTADYGQDTQPLQRLADLLATVGARMNPAPPKVACVYGELPAPGTPIAHEPFNWGTPRVGRVGEGGTVTYRVSTPTGPEGRQAVEFSFTNTLPVTASLSARVTLTSNTGEQQSADIAMDQLRPKATGTEPSLLLVPFAETECVTRIDVTDIAARPVPVTAISDHPARGVTPTEDVAVAQPAPPKPQVFPVAVKPPPTILGNVRPEPLPVFPKLQPPPAPAKAKPQPAPVVGGQPSTLAFAKPPLPAPAVAKPKAAPVPAKPPVPVAAKPKPAPAVANPPSEQAAASAGPPPETVVIDGVTYVKGREPKALGSVSGSAEPQPAQPVQ